MSYPPHREDVDLGPDGPKGIALTLVARASTHDQISVCGYLVDMFCLGVKDVIGPQRMRRRDLSGFVRTYVMVFLAPADAPCAITFGQHGKPLYVAGPHDHPLAVLETLEATLGTDGFAVAA